jgi:hypothetical protein
VVNDLLLQHQSSANEQLTVQIRKLWLNASASLWRHGSQIHEVQGQQIDKETKRSSERTAARTLKWTAISSHPGGLATQCATKSPQNHAHFLAHLAGKQNRSEAVEGKNRAWDPDLLLLGDLLLEPARLLPQRLHVSLHAPPLGRSLSLSPQLPQAAAVGPHVSAAVQLQRRIRVPAVAGPVACSSAHESPAEVHAPF